MFLVGLTVRTSNDLSRKPLEYETAKYIVCLWPSNARIDNWNKELQSLSILFEHLSEAVVYTFYVLYKRFWRFHWILRLNREFVWLLLYPNKIIWNFFERDEKCFAISRLQQNRHRKKNDRSTFCRGKRLWFRFHHFALRSVQKITVICHVISLNLTCFRCNHIRN